MKDKIVVCITQGDTNGIGYEVIIKALADARILENCVIVLYGSSRFFGIYRKFLPEVEQIATNVITAAEDADLSAFTDSGEISAWAEEAIRWTVAEGIMDGVGEGRINPKGLATRAQTAALLCRLISRLETSPESE